MSYFKTNNLFKGFANKLIIAIKETWIYWVILLVYMIARFYLFDDAFHVYAQKVTFINRLIHNVIMFPQIFSKITLAAWAKSQLIVWFWIVFYVLIIYSFWVNYKNKGLNKWLMFFSWGVITLLALVSQIGNVDNSGAGARVLYSVSTWSAVIIALPLLFIKRKLIIIYVVYAVFLIYVQSQALAQWTQASIVSKQLLISIKQIPTLENPNHWSLVLTPENIGVGLLGRNAQGGFSLPPFRDENMLDEMVPFVIGDLEIWRNRLLGNFVVEFKKNVKTPDQYPSKYYCTHQDGHLLELQINHSDLLTKMSWVRKWKQQTSELNCYF